MHLSTEQKQALHPINIIVFFLSLYVIVALIVDTFFPLSYEVSRLLHEVDYAICIVFFIDFLHRFFSAKNKWQYMRWGWIDLLSSIPMNVFLAGRLFRVFQLLRVIRAMRSIGFLSHYFLKNKIKGAFTSAAMLAFITVVFSAIGILKFEKDIPHSNIKTAEDALWWAYVTITTVGYGDKFPVTSEGRIIAAVLMTVGVGLFGTFTAYVASWFVAKKEEEIEEKKNEKTEQQKEEKERGSKKHQPKVVDKTDGAVGVKK
ncbi:MAG: ion transporter [Flavisolibacter sp.]|nr:ion transporter [Flavisolibacter sp.]